MDPIKSATEMVKGIRVSSVLGSILYITPFTLASLVVVSFNNNTIIQIFLMWIVGGLSTLFVLCFLGILIFGDHKELQSEDHTYRMKALEILGDEKNTLIDLKSVPKNNPELPIPEDLYIPEPLNPMFVEKNHE